MASARELLRHREERLNSKTLFIGWCMGISNGLGIVIILSWLVTLWTGTPLLTYQLSGILGLLTLLFLGIALFLLNRTRLTIAR